MNYRILDHKNDSKNATRHDVLVIFGEPEPKKEQGLFDWMWNGPKKEKPVEDAPAPSKFAIRVASQQKNVPIDDLIKAIADKKDKWKHNPVKGTYSINLPFYEGFAIIKPADDNTPLAEYFKAKKRKIDAPDPHLM